MFKQIAAVGLLGLAALVNAENYEENWDITYVEAAPDGFSRQVIGVNGVWPCPTINVNKGDTITVHVTNKLGNQNTGLHWHGFPQTSTSWMDGPSLVTQCPIAPNATFTYVVKAEIAGTFWYHSHNMGQYPDGLRGPIVVSDPEDPFVGEYDEEYVVTLSDWYHQDSLSLVQGMLVTSNTDGRPPLPDALLLNDGQGSQYPVDPSKTYRFRIVCLSALASVMMSIQNTQMTVIMADGGYVNSQDVDQLRITPAQRYDVLVKPSAGGNIPWLFNLDANPDFTGSNPPLSWGLNQTAVLTTDDSGDVAAFAVDAWQPADDSLWSTHSNEGILPAPVQTFPLSFGLCIDANGIPRMCMNNVTYIDQKVPTLYTASSVGDDNDNPAVYGQVNPIIMDTGDIYDIVLTNENPGVHPFHMHGHQFQVLARPASGTGAYPGDGNVQFAQNPVRRDTVSVMGNSYVVLRFEANNAGVYLFHCHIEWHVEMGLSATFIEGPDHLHSLPIPQDQLDACKAVGISTTGNAGGNLQNPLDQSNYNTEPPVTYIGSTFVPPSGSSCPAKRRRRHAKKL